MFDLGKLGDLSKMAQEAKTIQIKQEQSQKEQTELLRKILARLEEVVTILKQR